MNGELICSLEELSDRLEHTRKCTTEYLYEGRRCDCGAEDIREAIAKYRMSVWKEVTRPEPMRESSL